MRQVYRRDRRLALLQLRQGKCRCAATVRTFAGCPRRGCALPTRRTFRPVAARISQKPLFGLFEFPAFALHHFLFCVATKITRPLNRISIGKGGDLAAARATGRRDIEKRQCAQSLMRQRPINMQRATRHSFFPASGADQPGRPCRISGLRRAPVWHRMPNAGCPPRRVWHSVSLPPTPQPLKIRSRSAFFTRCRERWPSAKLR